MPLSEVANTTHEIFDTIWKKDKQWFLSLFYNYLQLVLLDHKHKLVDLEKVNFQRLILSGDFNVGRAE